MKDQMNENTQAIVVAADYYSGNLDGLVNPVSHCQTILTTMHEVTVHPKQNAENLRYLLLYIIISG